MRATTGETPSARACATENPVLAKPMQKTLTIDVPTMPGKRSRAPAAHAPATRPALLAVVPSGIQVPSPSNGKEISSAPLSTSRTHNEPSFPTETKSFPLEQIVRQETASCLDRTERSSSPLFAFHHLISPSVPPDTSVFPSGKNAKATVPFECPCDNHTAPPHLFRR